MADLPDAVQRFLERHIDSLEQLEILLLLRREPGLELNPAQVTAELRLGAGSELRLDALCAGGLLASTGDPPRYRYQASPQLDAEVEAVARCYAQYRVAMISFIFSPRRDGAIRGFADAFDLRRK